MSSIIEELQQKSDFFCERGVSEEEIKNAEDALGTIFAEDYKDYLSQYGSVSCGGHELTGVSEEQSLDVVRVTLRNRLNNPSIRTPLYVVEETHIDGIVIWQDSNGEVLQSEYQGPALKKYESLTDYVSTFTNRIP